MREQRMKNQFCYLNAFSISLSFCKISFGNSSNAEISVCFLLESKESIRAIFVVKDFFMIFTNAFYLNCFINILCIMIQYIHSILTPRKK